MREIAGVPGPPAELAPGSLLGVAPGCSIGLSLGGDGRAGRPSAWLAPLVPVAVALALATIRPIRGIGALVTPLGASVGALGPPLPALARPDARSDPA